VQIHGEAIRFGIHSGQQYTDFDQCLELWQRSEELGYDWVSNFDHFRPMDHPTGPCFEGTTLLAALAARTSHVRCGMLVLGVAYRHPAVVANIAATIDHLSGGRLELGVGAGANDIGQDQYGIPFPRVGVRMDMLDEACRVMRSLWTQETTTFEGRHYRLKDARMEPKPVQEHLPLVIGGAGERRTLRIVAEHADVWNTVAGDLDAYRHKLKVLAAHCADVGRDSADIRKSVMFRVVLAGNERKAEERLGELLGNVPSDSPMRQGWLTVGTPEQCVEHLRPYVDLGVGDFLFGIRSPVDWQTIELVAQQVAPALRA
jgi:F420-dependent oxidoreductase-like protein